MKYFLEPFVIDESHQDEFKQYIKKDKELLRPGWTVKQMQAFLNDMMRNREKEYYQLYHYEDIGRYCSGTVWSTQVSKRRYSRDEIIILIHINQIQNKRSKGLKANGPKQDSHFSQIGLMNKSARSWVKVDGHSLETVHYHPWWTVQFGLDLIWFDLFVF